MVFCYVLMTSGPSNSCRVVELIVGHSIKCMRVLGLSHAAQRKPIHKSIMQAHATWVTRRRRWGLEGLEACRRLKEFLRGEACHPQIHKYPSATTPCETLYRITLRVVIFVSEVISFSSINMDHLCCSFVASVAFAPFAALLVSGLGLVRVRVSGLGLVLFVAYLWHL